MKDNQTIEDEIKEYRAQFEKSMASIAAQQDKAQHELAELRVLHAEIAAQQKKTDKQLSELHGNWGRFVESLVEGGLVDLLSRRGIEVNDTYTRRKASYALGDGRRRETELDIVAANGEEVVVVEVKTTLRPNDVKRFVGTMEDITRYIPDYGSKTVYGAVAYIRCESEAGKYAERRGLYVIRATGRQRQHRECRGFQARAVHKRISSTAARPSQGGARLLAVC